MSEQKSDHRRQKPSHFTVYIIAPSLPDCYETGMFYGINARSNPNIKCVINPEFLKALKPTSPYLVKYAHWNFKRHNASRLELALEKARRTGRIRMADDVDLARVKER